MLVNDRCGDAHTAKSGAVLSGAFETDHEELEHSATTAAICMNEISGYHLGQRICSSMTERLMR
jgi:hypothetical protein